jgi:predicted HTH domain antitoxin
MDVVIPKDIVAATKMSEAQLKLEIAIMLYKHMMRR